MERQPLLFRKKWKVVNCRVGKLHVFVQCETKLRLPVGHAKTWPCYVLLLVSHVACSFLASLNEATYQIICF